MCRREWAADKLQKEVKRTLNEGRTKVEWKLNGRQMKTFNGKMIGRMA